MIEDVTVVRTIGALVALVNPGSILIGLALEMGRMWLAVALLRSIVYFAGFYWGLTGKVLVGAGGCVNFYTGMNEDFYIRISRYPGKDALPQTQRLPPGRTYT